MIRPFRPTDTTGLKTIFLQNVPKYFAPNEVQDFTHYLQQYGDTYYTVESNEKIIGGVGFQVLTDEHTGKITWIFFHPEFAGKGYGKMALLYCLHQLEAHDQVEKLIVETSQHASFFFEKFGFHTVATQKEYWGPGLDLIRMEKPV